MTSAAVTCTATALTTGMPCGRLVRRGQVTCSWHREERDNLALFDELERRHDHREELRRTRRARARAEAAQQAQQAAQHAAPAAAAAS